MTHENGNAPDAWRVARYALSCGIGAGLASQALLIAAANAEGYPVARPITPTSHWLWREEAGRFREADLRHTGVGLATNQAAAMFWGTLFGLHLGTRPRHSSSEILRDAAVVGGIPTPLDYGLIPKRLTPAWELALSKKSVALGMASMALGLALGGIAARNTGG